MIDCYVDPAFVFVNQLSASTSGSELIAAIESQALADSYRP